MITVWFPFKFPVNILLGHAVFKNKHMAGSKFLDPFKNSGRGGDIGIF